MNNFSQNVVSEIVFAIMYRDLCKGSYAKFNYYLNELGNGNIIMELLYFVIALALLKDLLNIIIINLNFLI